MIGDDFLMKSKYLIFSLIIIIFINLITLNVFAINISSSEEEEIILRAKTLINNYEFNYWLNSEKCHDVILNNLKKEKNFDDIVNRYNFLTDEVFKSDEDKTNYYEIILISILNDETYCNEFDSIYEDYVNDFTIKITQEITNGYGITDKVLETTKLNQDIIEKMKITNTYLKIDFLDYILVPSKGLKACIDEMSTISALGKITEDKVNVLKRIREYGKNDKKFCNAVDEVINLINESSEATVWHYLKNGFKAAKSEIMPFVNEKLTQMGMAAFGAGYLIAGYEGGKLVANNVWAADGISQKYLNMVALKSLENALIKSINEDKKKFLKEPNYENANILISETGFFKAVELYGLDLSLEFAKDVQKDALWAKFFGNKDDFKKTSESINTIKKLLIKSNFFSTNGKDIAEIINETGKNDISPSTWAINDITSAKKLNLLPKNLSHGYHSNITRAEFCTLLTYLIESKLGPIEDVIKQKGHIIYSPFEDTKYDYVNFIYQLDIISGISENIFNPLGEINRQEAAVMLKRTADILGYEITKENNIYNDVDIWAKDAVDYVVSNGIMYGTNNGFEPKKKLTKEQAIITMLRMYKNEGKKSIANNITSIDENKLKNVLQKYISKDIIKIYCNDYDNNGELEAYALVGEKYDDSYFCEIWFVNSKNAEMVFSKDGFDINSEFILDLEESKFFVINKYFTTGNISYVFGIKNRKPYQPSISGKGMSLGKTGVDNDIIMLHSTYDIYNNTGHTWKPYYFFWDGDFKEYGGIEITENDLLKCNGAKEILGIISNKGYSIKNIIYRNNDIININCFDSEYSNINISLKLMGNNIRLINAERDFKDYHFFDANFVNNMFYNGTYQTYLIPEIVVYPTKFPL